MAVTTTCSQNDLVVQLDVSEQQQLRYRIEASPGVTFRLRDHELGTLLSSDADGRERLWPRYPDEVPTADDVSHALGMQFSEGGDLRWLVELRSADGDLLQTVKDCTYHNDGAPADHFAALRILVTGRS